MNKPVAVSFLSTEGVGNSLARDLDEMPTLSVTCHDSLEATVDALAENDVEAVVWRGEVGGDRTTDPLRHLQKSEEGVPVVALLPDPTATVVESALDAGARDVMSVTRPALARVLKGRLRDIALRRRERAARRRTEQDLVQYRTLVENVGDPMYILDTSGNMEMANQAMADSLGAPLDDVVESHVGRFMPESDVERGAEVIADLLESPERTKAAWEMEVVHPDGSRTEHETMTAVVRDDSGDFAGTVGVVRDITERKERERRLERYETIVEASGDPVYAVDETGRYTFINERGAEMTGYRPEALVGEPTATVTTPEGVERGEEVLTDLITDPDRNRATFEMPLVTADGETIPVENHVALLPPDEDGSYRGSTGIVRDISERQAREEALRERNERLDEFARVVAHDLRNPLHVADLRLELAIETGDDEHLEQVADAHERMGSLIDDLLTLAREGIDVDEREPVSLAAVAKQAWDTSRTGDATLDVRSDALVRAAPAQLSQALENLFRNAVEHGGESVTVTVDLVDDEGFFVADDGPGIDPDIRDSLFEAGVSGDGDTGLGLDIVQRIVEAHGWTVEAGDSAAGGARFEVTGVDLGPESDG